MVTVTIRDLDDQVRKRLRARAARNGRSMETEICAILTAAASEPAGAPGLAQALLERFGAVGGVALDPPLRSSAPSPSRPARHER